MTRRLEFAASVRFRAVGAKRAIQAERRAAIATGTPRRTVRVDDGLWQAASARAAERGEDLSTVIRRALAAYVAAEAAE
jgi:hypothetical protein